MAKVKLYKFSNVLLNALHNDRISFEALLGYKLSEDWPNSDFLEAIPFFISLRKASPELEKFNFLIVDENTKKIVGEIGAKNITIECLKKKFYQSWK